MTDLSKLPKYWVVKNDGSQLFIDTVIKVLNEIGSNMGIPWKGTAKEQYYGYDGDTNTYININSFSNNPTILTLEQFIELTIGWIPKRGDIVYCSDKEGVFNEDDEYIYLATIEGACEPYITVHPNWKFDFEKRFPFLTSSWEYISPVPSKVESTATKLTVAEIEEKLGFKVEIISDKL